MRLRFETFRFVGFEDPQTEFERTTRRCEGIEPGWPAVTHVTDAVFVPFSWTGSSSGDVPITGGLYGADGSRIAQAEHLRYPNPWPARIPPPFAKNLPVIKDVVDYAGVYFAHFGHFTLESMSRLWFESRKPRGSRVLFHNLVGFPREPHAREIFAALGLAEGRLLARRDPVRLRSVRIPEQAFVLNSRAFENHRHTFTKIGALMDTLDAPETDQPLYLSRSALARHQRRIINEPVLEEMLERNGFRVFHPERHSLREQLQVVNRHKYLFGPWGSAFRPALFSPRAKLACQFMEEFPNANFLMEACLSGARTWFVKCTDDGPLSHNKYRWEAALWFDLDRVMAFLKTEGFVRNTEVPKARLAQCLARVAPESIFVRTYAFARRGHAEELQSLKKTLGDSNAEPECTTAFDCALAEAALAGGDAAKAEALLLQVVASANGNARTHFLLSMALAHQERLQDAVIHAGTAIALLPDDPKMHHHLGHLLRRQGDLHGAEAAQRKALQLDPSFASALRQLGGILAAANRLEEGIAAARQAVALDRYDTDLQCDLASMLAKAGHPEEAEQWCLAALRLDDICIRALKQLRRIRAGKPE